MVKLIICVTSGRPLIYGFKRGEFIWSEEHKCYIYHGKEFDEVEFNKVADRALRSFSDMLPTVRIISEPAKAPISEIPSDDLRPITIEEATAFLMREAPHLLATDKPEPREMQEITSRRKRVGSTA